MSSLRSKLGYSSPFDDALSKPLIELQDDTATTTSTTSRDSTHNKSAPLNYQAAYTNKLAPLSSSASYSPPPTLDEEKQDTQQFLLYSQLTSETPQQIGTHIDTELLRERNSESQHISTQMRQILDINLDLAFLVSSQQENIDGVEDNAFEIHDNAERGVSHLRRAKGLMKNAMNSEGLMRIFFLVVAVGGLFIALVLLLEAL
jgi:hypothetical protein